MDFNSSAMSTRRVLTGMVSSFDYSSMLVDTSLAEVHNTGAMVR